MTKDKQRSLFKGKKLKIEIFGGSHSPEIGVVCDGLDGANFSKEKLQEFMDRRKPKNTVFSTKRKEADEVLFESGVDGEKVVGKMRAVIKNTNQKSIDYEKNKKIPRPSHADFVAFSKYGDTFDYRGGGKFSGRLTAPMCIVGGIAKQVLEQKGITVTAFISRIGKVCGKTYDDICQQNFNQSQVDKDFPTLIGSDKQKMLEEIESARIDCDSVGGVIDCVITGVPVGAGEYMFDSVEGVISSPAFAVPAVKGIEFGSGFAFSSMRGSEANDGFFYEDGQVKTFTNNNGGINGGMANGMPITFRVVIKPTPSIGKEQDSVNLDTKEKVKLKIEGRHDSCIVPRAVPVIEAIASLAIYECL